VPKKFFFSLQKPLQGSPKASKRKAKHHTKQEKQMKKGKPNMRGYLL
jgi:hypothetical protein